MIKNEQDSQTSMTFCSSCKYRYILYINQVIFLITIVGKVSSITMVNYYFFYVL